MKLEVCVQWLKELACDCGDDDDDDDTIPNNANIPTDQQNNKLKNKQANKVQLKLSSL